MNKEKIKEYRKKPVIIQAFRWNGDNTTEILQWMFPDLEPDAKASQLTIDTLEGKLNASVGDYIIRGVKGEFYPCKPDIFKQTYELDILPQGNGEGLVDVGNISKLEGNLDDWGKSVAKAQKALDDMNKQKEIGEMFEEIDKAVKWREMSSWNSQYLTIAEDKLQALKAKHNIKE